MSGRARNPQLYAEIERLLRSSTLPRYQIAVECGTHAETVYRHAKKLGILPKARSRGLSLKGVQRREIGAKYGWLRDGARTPSALKAHRAMIEHDCFHGNPAHVEALRDAAKAFDALLKAERQKGRRGIHVPSRRERERRAS